MGGLSLTEQVTGVKIQEGSPANYTIPFIKVNVIMMMMSIQSWEPESYFVGEDLELTRGYDLMTCYTILLIITNLPNVMIINNYEKNQKTIILILGS